MLDIDSLYHISWFIGQERRVPGFVLNGRDDIGQSLSSGKHCDNLIGDHGCHRGAAVATSVVSIVRCHPHVKKYLPISVQWGFQQEFRGRNHWCFKG